MSLTYVVYCFFINVSKVYNNVMFTDEFKAKSIILHPWMGCLMHADDLFQVTSKQCGPEADVRGTERRMGTAIESNHLVWLR